MIDIYKEVSEILNKPVSKSTPLTELLDYAASKGYPVQIRCYADKIHEFTVAWIVAGDLVDRYRT